MMNMDFSKQAFDLHLLDGKLMGTKCESCGKLYLPPRPICAACFSTEMQWVEMSIKGKIVAFTIVYIASTAMIEAGYGRENPHCSGLVKLDNGQTISAQILGVPVKEPDAIKIGTPVELTFVDRNGGEKAGKHPAFRIVE
jgi:uncharacterized OB-fold protein